MAGYVNTSATKSMQLDETLILHPGQQRLRGPRHRTWWTVASVVLIASSCLWVKSLWRDKQATSYNASNLSNKKFDWYSVS